MRMLLLGLSLISSAAHAGGKVSDDLCAIRPDLCDGGTNAGSVAELTRQARRSVRAHAPEITAAARKVASVGRRVTARSITCRPASVAITAKNANDPICGSTASADAGGRAIASVAPASASIDFNSYMQANSRNPALSRRIDDYQTAFRDTARPATFVAPDVEGSGVREGAPAAPAAQARNNN